MANNPPPDFSPLLAVQGENILTLDKLHDICVLQQQTDRRNDLWDGLASLCVRLYSAGMSGLDLWVDGSYMTKKPRPRNVDCVLWVPQSHVDHCTERQHNELLPLKDRNAVEIKHCVKLHILPPEEQKNIDYWTNWFSVARDGVTPKGFARLTL